jgi:hypothetical protein
MRNALTLLTVLISILSIESQAQINKGQVSGRVIDGNTKTIESATISLLRVKDSSVAKISVADKAGQFAFDGVAEGRYFVAITAVGHTPGYSEVFEISPSNNAVILKTIELVPAAKSINGVTVTARKPLIEQKLDRTIVNVESSISAVGGTAMEVLEKSPGITIDKDGNISLKGKQGVQIYIDGRPSYLGGADLANLLRSMSASQLEQIEIMTNPPAKYEAAGNSGIINIKTKKNKQFGYNGSLTTGFTQGIYPRFNESGNFNYRNGKVNLFSSINYNRNHRKEVLDISRNFMDQTTKNIVSIFDQKSNMVNESHFFSAKAGLDYFATKKTTLGLVLNGYYNPRTWTSTTHTEIFNPNSVLQSQTKAFSQTKSKWKNFSANGYFKIALDSAGQDLTGDLDYIQYRSTSMQPLISSYFNNMGQLTKIPDTLNGDLPQDITIYSAKMDYSKPLKKGAKFEVGFKTSYVKTDNNARYDTLRNGQAIPDFNRSNHFVYEENINAAYINFSTPLGKKWSGQFGLRAENTNAKGNQLTTGDSFKRNYTQLFPTAYLQYTANEKNQFVIKYGRRIERPDYADLNPFINFLDRYTFEKGNPDLRPQFSHNIELSHTYGGFLTTTANYSKTTDIIQQVIEQKEATNETFIKKANIASQNQYGLSVTAFKQINKWWSGSIYASVSNSRFKGVVNSDYVSLGVTTFITQIQQQFKWGKGWGVEVSGFYRSKGLEGVIFIEPIKQVEAGLSKQVLKGKGTVKLSFRDIFRGAVYKGYINYGTVDARFRDVNDQRAVGMSFTWRFNKGKLKASGGRREGSASDEKNRVRSGN